MLEHKDAYFGTRAPNRPYEAPTPRIILRTLDVQMTITCNVSLLADFVCPFLPVAATATLQVPNRRGGTSDAVVND